MLELLDASPGSFPDVVFLPGTTWETQSEFWDPSFSLASLSYFECVEIKPANGRSVSCQSKSKDEYFYQRFK